jgi:hypothetical protein
MRLSLPRGTVEMFSSHYSDVLLLETWSSMRALKLPSCNFFVVITQLWRVTDMRLSLPRETVETSSSCDLGVLALKTLVFYEGSQTPKF